MARIFFTFLLFFCIKNVKKTLATVFEVHPTLTKIYYIEGLLLNLDRATNQDVLLIAFFECPFSQIRRPLWMVSWFLYFWHNALSSV